MTSYNLTHLKELESEAIFILREVASQFEKPVMLFSGGKDSIIMFHLARKAFFPAKIPFPLMHVDTGHNFPETIKYRDQIIKETKFKGTKPPVERETPPPHNSLPPDLEYLSQEIQQQNGNIQSRKSVEGFPTRMIWCFSKPKKSSR